MVEFAAGSVKDLAGERFAGTSSYNFTTANTMGQVTGAALLNQLIADLGVTTPSGLVNQVLAARLDQMQEAGVFSNVQIAVVLASNPVIRTSVPEGKNPITEIVASIASAKAQYRKCYWWYRSHNITA